MCEGDAWPLPYFPDTSDSNTWMSMETIASLLLWVKGDCFITLYATVGITRLVPRERVDHSMQLFAIAPPRNAVTPQAPMAVKSASAVLSRPPGLWKARIYVWCVHRSRTKEECDLPESWSGCLDQLLSLTAFIIQIWTDFAHNHSSRIYPGFGYEIPLSCSRTIHLYCIKSQQE